MIDSHCHLDFDAYDDDREAVWARARQAGVQAVVVPAYAPSGWPGALALAERLEGVHVALGIHPWAIAGLSEGAVAGALGELEVSAKLDGAVAVGECGLDKVVAQRGGASLVRQRKLFEAQLELAVQLELPVILHVVRAHGLALEVLKALAPLPGGVLHGFGGPVELVREYAALGLSFSFAPGVVRREAERVRAAAAAVPREALLVESDGPDQGLPGANRGEPAHVAQVCEALAELRGESVQSVREATTQNARALFRL